MFFPQVTRYQSDPGQATAYMIGQLDIIESRTHAEEELKDDFTLPDFHYQVKIWCSEQEVYHVVSVLILTWLLVKENDWFLIK